MSKKIDYQEAMTLLSDEEYSPFDDVKEWYYEKCCALYRNPTKSRTPESITAEVFCKDFGWLRERYWCEFGDMTDGEFFEDAMDNSYVNFELLNDDEWYWWVEMNPNIDWQWFGQ